MSIRSDGKRPDGLALSCQDRCYPLPEATMSDLAEQILDAALERAERTGWEPLRLHDVAADLDISLDDVRQHYREKDELIDAWFDRADQAMLQASEAPGFEALSSRERVQRVILTWLQALESHREVTRQMILSKLEFGHLHIQIPAVMRISRTVQWVREAAARDASFLRRGLEETVLTGIYLATFTRWLRDRSGNTDDIARFLEQQLRRAERAEGVLSVLSRDRR